MEKALQFLPSSRISFLGTLIHYSWAFSSSFILILLAKDITSMYRNRNIYLGGDLANELTGNFRVSEHLVMNSVKSL